MDIYIKNIATSISKSLLTFVNKSIVDDGIFYRVCIGEFKDMSAAVELKNTAISKGFNNTHIINSL